MATNLLPGSKAKPNQFPHSIAVYVVGSFRCGGSIITSLKILTAGHCVIDVHSDCKKISANLISVQGGGSELGGKQLQFGAERIAVHPKYSQCRLEKIMNDLAMIFLSNDIPLDGIHFQQIGIQNKAVAINSPCLVVGWGVNYNSTIQEDILSIGKVMINAPAICEFFYGNINESSSIICAGFLAPATPCVGDSGGALLCNNLATGVVSFGSVGCFIGAPVVYVNITVYSDWISSNRGNLNVANCWAFVLCLILIKIS